MNIRQQRRSRLSGGSRRPLAATPRSLQRSPGAAPRLAPPSPPPPPSPAGRSVSGALVWLEQCGAERVVAGAVSVGIDQCRRVEAGSGERKGRPVTTRQQEAGRRAGGT